MLKQSKMILSPYHQVGTSGIMSLIITVESASEKELLKLVEEYNLDISDYMKV